MDRVLRGWVVAAMVGITSPACVTSNRIVCGEQFCAEGTTCAEVAPGNYACVRDEHYVACAMHAERDACSYERGASTIKGTCVGGACIERRCGDGLRDVEEVCDDGNEISGDGCSRLCLSDERCGNGIVDTELGEECDTGVIGLSGDGCTSRCIAEYPMWRDVQFAGPPLRFAHQLVSDPLRGVVMFGGASVDDDGQLNNKITRPSFEDMWRWDGRSWIRIVPIRALPALASASVTYDAVRRRVMVFGGYLTDSTASSTLWEWDGLTWTSLSSGSTVNPGPRAEAGLACNDGTCVLFGGFTDSATTALDDLWIWNGAQWSLVVPPVSPLARGRALMTYNPRPGAPRIVLHGGLTVMPGGSFYLNDTWELALAPNIRWSRTNPPPLGGPGPSPATERQLGDQFGTSLLVTAVDPTPIWHYDAKWTSGVPLVSPTLEPSVAAARDVSRGVLVISSGGTVDELTPQWDPPFLNGSWSSPPVRTALPVGPTPAAYDATSGHVIAIIGARTWAWNGDGWRLLVEIETPPAGSVLIHDAACDQIVSYGFGTTSVLTNPMGATPQWMVRPTPPELTTVRSHAMAYDAARDVVVMFGGTTMIGAAVGTDVWEWGRAPGAMCTEKAWTRTSPSTGPVDRRSATLSYDPIRRRVLLFGGQGSAIGTPDLADLWAWDGTSWTALATATSPPPRSSHGAAYDARLDRLMVFAGATGATNRDDLWAFDPVGKAWQRYTPVLSPTPRSQVTVTPDRTGRLLAIGGVTFGAQYAGMFRFGFEQIVEPREQCRDGSLDEDGDFLHGCDDPDCRGRCAPLCPVDVEFASCTGPRCGDGTCSLLEDFHLCPADCGPL